MDSKIQILANERSILLIAEGLVMASRRRFLTSVGAIGVLSLSGCTATGGSSYEPGTDDTTEWPMPANDRGYSGYNPDAAGPREGVTERWTTRLSGLGSAARPVVAAGHVLVPTSGALVALNLQTGKEQWRYGQEKPWPSAPVVRDGIAYLGFADQPALIALDVETGDEQWRVETTGNILTAPTFDVGYDTLYVGDDTGRVYRISPKRGEITLRGEVFGPVTALAHRRSLLVGTESGEVHNLYPNEDAFTGNWRKKVGGWVTALALSRDGDIFVATFGGPTYRLLSGGEVGRNKWTVEAAGTFLAATNDDVIATDGGSLQVIDADSGSVRWQSDGGYDAAPAIAGDTIYVGGGEKGENGNGFMAAYAISNGDGIGPLTLNRQRWQFDVDSAVMQGVAVADGAVFGATQGLEESPTRVYALDPI